MVVDAVAIEHRSLPSPVGLAETEEFCESTGQQVHEQTKGGNDATIWKVRQWIIAVIFIGCIGLTREKADNFLGARALPGCG